ncbi:MAG: type I-E CRISPR-associated protein Cse2/CasB [Chloroflexota bacterium]|nr:MAG: type I-E CRISPR-associated protein Cse2/CasB [Chloroflexota bacterium]
MSNSEPTPRQRQIAAFVAALERLDASGRARLKRNAGRALGEARDVHRVFFQALPYDVHERQYDDYFLVASLFPLAPHRAGAGSLGATLRQVRQIRGGAERANSLDRRFQALIDSEREQLPFRLRQAVRLAAADDVAIDWAQLLSDLLAWDLDGRPVQLRWARDYFVGQAVADEASNA